jgi:hypothetical protein
MDDMYKGESSLFTMSSVLRTFLTIGFDTGIASGITINAKNSETYPIDDKETSFILAWDSPLVNKQ